MMDYFFYNQSHRESYTIRVKKFSRFTSTIFLLTCLLPFLVALLFYLNVFISKHSISEGLEAPVAKVITSDGIGSAFLVSQEYLLTARHVLGGLTIGDEVLLEFSKAIPPREISARIEFLEISEISPIYMQVPLKYFLDDFALLRVNPIDDIEPLVLGDSDFVEELNEVILIGYPNNDYSKTNGTINSNSYQGLDLFKSNVTSNPGNSGGPCLLLEEETVIGIIVGSGDPDNQGENVILKINYVLQYLSSKGYDLE